jgi:hypothetical protein
MSKKTIKQNLITDEEVRQLVIARLRALSSGRKISIGAEGEFSKEELIEKVEKKDKIGKKIIEIQLDYLRSFKQNLSILE